MNLRLITKNATLFIKTSFLAGIFITYSSCQSKIQDQTRILDKTYKNQIIEGRKVIRNYMMTSFTPGLSISVSMNNEIVWSEGYGLASKELKVPATRETKYRIGTTSEMLTVFTIAKLHEEGKLDITESFYKYIPNFPKKKNDFTIKQLGVNSAGFKADSHDLLLNKNGFKSLKEYISFYENDSLVYYPGEFMQSSVYSTALLGLVAENITETYYGKLVKNTILDTLKLNNTQIDHPYNIIENRSACYDHDYIARLINAQIVNYRFISPSHGFLSTADDLNKAAQTIMEPGFFKQETLDLFTTPFKLKDGTETNRSFGWWIFKLKDKTAYVQLGATTGGNSLVAVYPEEKLVITACSNIKDENFDFPIAAIADVFLNNGVEE